MAISDRTRKKLWAKSGNRCSICKIELFSGQDKENDFNVGEECHIISSKSKGPRHKPNLKDYDTIDNLILLCRNHHREIDELPDTYTEEIVRYIKENHEKWVQSTINKAINDSNHIEPKLLIRITSGKDLLNIVAGCHGVKYDYDEIESKDDAEYIGSTIQNIIDLGEIDEFAEAYDKVKLGFGLNEILKELDEKGYYLFGHRLTEKVEFRNEVFENWIIAYLIIKKKDNPDIITFNNKK